MVLRILTTSLNRPFAHHRLTLPHIISSLTKRTEAPRNGSGQSDWLLHRYSRHLLSGVWQEIQTFDVAILQLDIAVIQNSFIYGRLWLI